MAMDILKMSLSSISLILVIIIIRALTLHKLPKKTFLVLWGVALYRLLIPFSLSSRFSIYTIADILKNKVSTINIPSMVTTMPNIGMTDNSISTMLSNETIKNISPVIIVWIVGLLGLALFFLVTHIRCRIEYKTSLPIDNEFVKDWQQRHHICRRVQIRQSDRIVAPLTYGIFNPVILLPKKTDLMDETRLGYILTHEFVHIRKFDILKKLILVFALCVHWFNPFVWVMYMLVSKDIELSCDETVVRIFGEDMRSNYAMTLISLEEKKSRLTPLCNNFCKNSIEERIVSIMKINKTSFTGILLALALIISTTVIFATNAASATDKEQESKHITAVEEEITYVETPESKAKAFAMYEQYGLSYNKDRDQLFYKGELVRYFEDYYPLGEGTSAGRDYFNENGIIDVHALRDLSQLTRNPDGSTNPSGKLIGVEPYSKAEFDARNVDELKNPSQTYTASIDESTENNNSDVAQELLLQDGDSPVVHYISTENMMMPDELAKVYAVYEPFGVTYDKDQDCFYYNGKLVREFIDILSSNGEDLDRGKFKGSFRQMNNLDGKGEIDIKAIRDYTKLNSEGEGELIGIEVVK
ncbi:M56 family metallopeptidase [Tissierella carlieri]|uniref:M56 family metallopeptidase n=1 Tax=Tissierella carlieri TaxID=689904 RepID=UPI0030B91B5A